MDPTAPAADYSWVYWTLAVLVGIGILVLWWVLRKSRRMPGEHVFRASRLSKGNRVFPAQVVISATSITLYHAQWIGRLEESIHMAHIASIKIDTNLIFANVFIETTGGHNPITCYGHTKGDAVKMKKVVETFQSEYYKKKQ